MSDLAAAIGLVLVIEGIFYAGFPQAMKGFMRRAIELPDSAFRGAGLGGLAIGLAIVWLVRS
jgi:uncharacterized protein YjeT (DUF2065 family)